MDNFFALGEDKLDVAWVGHVRVDLVSLAAFFEFCLYKNEDIHDREHGRYVCDPWGPG